MEVLYLRVITLLLCMQLSKVVKSEILEPIYWNSSNPLFRTPQLSIDVKLEDKLDIICPLKSREDKNLFFKIYLVSHESYKACDVSRGRRLLTCETPELEKKYTFFFQEISPSPFALEFQVGKSYYIISTSDGSKEGLDQSEGGSCVRHNVKLKINIHRNNQQTDEEEDNVTDYKTEASEKHQIENLPYYNPNDNEESNENVEKPINNDRFLSNPTRGYSKPKKLNYEKDPGDQGSVEGQMIMGIVVGAGVVIFALLCLLVGYRVWSRKRRKNSKKYLYHQPGRPNMNHIPSQVTLLPINNVSRGHSRMDTATAQMSRVNGRGQIVPRSPPPYNESFLDNGGSIVAV